MQQEKLTETDIALVTCSYGPDFKRCQRLCASVDQYVPAAIEHILVVPAEDQKLFSQLGTGNRVIVSVEDTLPCRFSRIPMTRKWWLGPNFWPVRGWMLQQLTKLSADRLTDRELIMFVDSDIEFIRPLLTGLIVQGELCRLHRHPGEKNTGEHLRWHHMAAEVLDLPKQYFGSDYIAPLVTWRRSNLISLKNIMQIRSQLPWHELLLRRLTMSEYILYGVYVEHVLGEDNNGHFPDDGTLCHCCWFGEDANLLNREQRVSDSSLAVLIQSNIGLSVDHVDALMQQVRTQLAR